LRVGLKINQHQLDWATLADRVSYAEAQGSDGAWLFDHFEATEGDPAGPCMEGWSLLGALAARTERIRLGVMVTGITYRHPSILATQAVTIDQIAEVAWSSGWGQRGTRRSTASSACRSRTSASGWSASRRARRSSAC
jgi:hypothetical protein